ncbi:hypothetical protein ACODT5_28620 [Streptomyces sp. 5.8]|uniref:hypothetical protein n=1 Tax=Streptomyces sp. 5.8 TaxID=3406571 RepID=UPI003BB601BD
MSRALYEIDPETGARTPLDPAAIETARAEARLRRRTLWADESQRRTDRAALRQHLAALGIDPGEIRAVLGPGLHPSKARPAPPRNPGSSPD